MVGTTQRGRSGIPGFICAAKIGQEPGHITATVFEITGERSEIRMFDTIADQLALRMGNGGVPSREIQIEQGHPAFFGEHRQPILGQNTLLFEFLAFGNIQMEAHHAL